jgi:uncharacterized membrane protein YdcZ (DUF606 family)
MTNLKKLLAVLFVAAGVVALAYRNFQITDRTRSADLGPLEIRMKRRVNVPVWAGVALVVVGTGLLVYERRK